MTPVQIDLNSDTEGWRIGNGLAECQVRVVAGELVWQVIDLARDRIPIPPSPAPHLEVDRDRVRWAHIDATAEELPLFPGLAQFSIRAHLGRSREPA